MGLETLSEFDKVRCASVSRIVNLHNTLGGTPQREISGYKKISNKFLRLKYKKLNLERRLRIWDGIFRDPSSQNLEKNHGIIFDNFKKNIFQGPFL